MPCAALCSRPGSSRSWSRAEFNRALPSNLFFWRDSTGNEIDVLADQGEHLSPIEVKAGKTIAADYFAGLQRWCTLAGTAAGKAALVYAGMEQQRRGDVTVLPWRKIEELAGKI